AREHARENRDAHAHHDLGVVRRALRGDGPAVVDPDVPDAAPARTLELPLDRAPEAAALLRHERPLHAAEGHPEGGARAEQPLELLVAAAADERREGAFGQRVQPPPQRRATAVAARGVAIGERVGGGWLALRRDDV